VRDRRIRSGVTAFDMKAFFVFSTLLAACVSCFFMSSFATAQTTGPTTTATCAVLDYTCASVDSAFVPSAISLSIVSGEMLVTCQGTTTNMPSTSTTCDHANQKSGCTVTVGNRIIAITHWTESIMPSGSVTMTCKKWVGG
jgi:hypothetical protein